MRQIYYKCIWSFLTIFRVANNHNEDVTHKSFNRYSYMQPKLPFCMVYFPFCKKRHTTSIDSSSRMDIFFNNTEILALQTVDKQR